MKKQIPEEWWSISANVLDAVTHTQHDGDQGLKDESQPAWSMETRHHVICEPP